MRLFSLAVVAGLFAVGFTYAQEKKPEVKKADGEKKAAKVMGTLTKIDGGKLTVTTKGDGGEKAVEYTTNDKTKFFKEEAAEKKEGDKKEDKKIADEKKPADKPADKPAEKKAAPKRTEIKLADLKVDSRVAVIAGEDKVVTELVVLPAAPKKEGK